MNYKHIILIGNQTFQLLQNGSKGYAYILHNDFYKIKIAQHRSTSENFFPLFIKIKQTYGQKVYKLHGTALSNNKKINYMYK